MNALIVSNFFFPNYRIASFRMNAFAKYFREAGHEVTEKCLRESYKKISTKEHESRKFGTPTDTNPFGDSGSYRYTSIQLR